MHTLATTRMSSKGQIVIQDAIRKQMNLKPGVEFIVLGEDDVVILKTITAPGMDEFDGLIKQARQQAKLAGLKRTEISAALTSARGRK